MSSAQEGNNVGGATHPGSESELNVRIDNTTIGSIIFPSASSVNVFPASDHPAVVQSDTSREPTKKARASAPLGNELKRCLNKFISEKVNSFSPKNLRTPSQEKWPELQSVNMFDSQGHFRTISGRDSLETQAKISSFEDSNINMDNIFTDVKRFLLIVGDKGSGKSTFAKRYGQRVLSREIQGMKHISVVHFIDARHLALDEDKVSFFDFFFSKLVHGFDELPENARSSLRNEENQKEILIIIDGLNDLNNFCMDRPYKAIGYDDLAEPKVIFYNLLSGRLLPGVKLLATSLLRTVQDYHPTAQPNRTIKLNGFTDENSEYLFREFVGEDIEINWEKFPDKLKLLCSTPLLLVYVAFMFKSDIEESPIDVVDFTSILLRVIQNFCNRNKWKRDSSIFKNLKKFCLELCKRGRVMFGDSDMDRHGLDSKDTGIMSLCNELPETMVGVLEPNLCDNRVCFSHISIQEALASLGFLDLPVTEFEEVLNEDMQTLRFSTVKQLACGALINARALLKIFTENISSLNEKRTLLLKSMRQSLSTRLHPEMMLHHLKCLNEMGILDDDSLHPNVIDISGQDLDKCTTHIISPVVARCGNLSELSLYHCNLDDGKVVTLCDFLEGSKLQIHMLNLGFNTKLGPITMQRLARVTCLCKVHELDLHACDLISSHMTAFCLEFRKHPEKTLKNLLLRANPELGESGLTAVAETVEVGHLQKLDISRCGVSADILQKMAPHLRSLTALVLTQNFADGTAMDKRKMTVVGECVASNGNINELHINWCYLKRRDLVDLEKSLRNTEIKALNISNNPALSSIKDSSMEVLCNMVKKCKTDRMDIHKCGFSWEQKTKLREYVKEFSRMDTYISMELDDGEFEETLERNKGRFLDISLRNTKEDLGGLPRLLTEYRTRFRRLCLPEGKSATKTDIEILLQLLPFISEELWLGEWDIDEPGKTKLLEGISEHADGSKFKIFLKDGVVLSWQG